MKYNHLTGRDALIALLLLVVTLIVGLGILDKGHEWGDDFAGYMLHAQTLVNGDFDAMAQLNRSFHKKIESLSDKKRILRVIDDQEEYITRFSAITIASIERRAHAHEEHKQMADALENRDLEGLKQLFVNHLEESKQTCIAAVKNRRF